MQNFIKKSLAILLVAIMALSVAPLAGMFIIANAEIVKNGNCGADTGGTNLTWSYDDATDTLAIAGTGKMKNYASASAAPWYNKTYGENQPIKIVAVTIAATVTSIGDYAFSNCAALETVTFAGTSTVESIGSHAFFNCSSLTAVALPASVRTIGSGAFAGSGITAFELPAGVATIAPGAFESCADLETLTFAAGSTLTTIENWAFNGCSSLNGVDLPATVTTIGDYAFTNCSAATEIIIPATVISLGANAVTGCSSISSIALPETIEVLGDNYFSGCTALTSITIPASVTAIGENAFMNCTSLETVEFAEGSKLETIGANAFYNCSALSAFTVPAYVTSIGQKTVTVNDAPVEYDYYHVFDLCVALESFTVDSENEAYSSDEAGALYNKDKTVLYKFPAASEATTYEIGKDVTVITDYAFESCKNITAYTVEDGSLNFSADAAGILFDKSGSHLIQYPSGSEATNCPLVDGLKSIGPKAFIDCENLTEFIHIPYTVKAAGFCSDSFVNIPSSCNFCCNNSNESHDIQVYVVEGLKRLYTPCRGHAIECEHQFVETGRIEPTCTQAGEKVLTCTICATKKVESLPIIKHTYGDSVVVDPTSCAVGGEGSNTATCTVCGFSSTTPIRKDHTFVESAENSVAPSCTTAGKKVLICSECQTRQETELKALGHKFGDWIVDTNNGIGVGGKRHHICTVCEETVEEILPPLPSIKIDATETTTAVYKGDNLVLTCTVTDLGKYAILWECSDPEKATITVDALNATQCTVTAIGNGNITITAKVLTLAGNEVKDGKDQVIDVSDSLECKASMTVWQQIVGFFRKIMAKLDLSNIIGGLV